MHLPEALTGHEVFKLFTPPEVDQISRLTSEMRFKAGEVIYRRASPADHFFIVFEGTVDLMLPGGEQGHHEIKITRVNKGQLLGIAPFLGHERYTVRAVAATDVTLLAFESKSFMAILERNLAALNSVNAAVARTYYARYMGLLGKVQGAVTQLLTVWV